MKKIVFLTALLSIVSITNAQDRQEAIRTQNVQKSWVKNIPFQALPLTRGAGEIIQIERNPKDPYQLYVALSQSGVWYSDNNGTSFTPTFSETMSPQTMAMAVDWDNRTLWVATYQGVFIKEYAKDWVTAAPIGNMNVRQIVLTSPTNACLNALGEDGSIAGVLCTSDKGKSWKQTFAQVGVSELKKVPSADQTLYMTAWDIEKTPYNINPSGKKSGIYKSTNAGDSWELISTAGSGFPQGNIGKISLAVFSPTSLYALVDNRERVKESLNEISLQGLSSKDFLGLDNEKINQYIYNHFLQNKYNANSLKEMVRAGIAPNELTKLTDALPAVVGAEIYYSNDGGKSWVKKNNKPLTNVFYSKGYEVGALAVNPQQENELYLSGVPLLKSNNGGITWTLIKDNPMNQKVYQLSADGKQIILVTSQGAFQSLDQGRTWAKQEMPQTAYVTSLTIGKPSEGALYANILNGGVVKYTNNQWLMVSSENGKLVTTPENKSFLAQPFGEILPLRQSRIVLPYDKKTKQRYPIETTLSLSPQNNTILYAGANVLFQSLNEGKAWKAISPDLTNGDKGGNLSYGTISAISESPFQFGLLYTGSDDGMIYTSDNGGVSWQMIYSSFPAQNRVSCLLASKHKQERVYAILQNSNHQALIFRSNNMGKSWDNLKANLPEETANVIVEDPSNEQVLYLGTENGLYVSFDMGEKWHVFKQNLPRTSVSAIAINPQDNQLYIGTKGHGFFTANIASLREIRAAVQDQLFYPLKDTYSIKYSAQWGNAENPWAAPKVPVLYLESFASMDSTEVKISVVKNKITLSKFSYQTKVGFNFIPFDLVFNEEGRIAYEKKLLTTFKKADNGKCYLPKGTYQLIFEVEGFEQERTLVIE